MNTKESLGCPHPVRVSALLIAFLGVLSHGCDSKSQHSGSTDQASDLASRGKSVFLGRCSTCHGPEGKGDGPSAASLDPSPRNFTDPEWQKKISDAEIRKIIVEGGAAVGKSTAMPPAPDLESNEQDLSALVSYIRSL